MTKQEKTSDDKWRQQLTEEEYHVTREKGTEKPFSGEYHNHKEKGVYVCKCCGEKLFHSDTKYDSGTGWPSFWEPHDGTNIKQEIDNSYGMVRTEVMCKNCDAHLGHLFPDGPKPTGLRYCINSCSLNFHDEEDRD